MIVNLKKIFHRLFLFTLVWLILEGIFRKWILPDFSAAIFFIKYILVGILYTVYILQFNAIPKIKRLDQLFIAIYIIWCLFSVFNNRLSTSLIVPVVGLVLHLGFIPISTLTQYFIKNEKSVELFIKTVAYLSLGLTILGSYQYYQPIDHPINKFVNETQLMTRIGDFVRITSVFSFVKIYNVYLLFSLTLLTSYMYKRLLNGQSIIFYIGIIIMLIINSFMTGSRLPIGISFLNITAISIFIFFNYNVLRKTVVFVSISSIIVFSALYFSTSMLNDSVDAFVKRTTNVEQKAKDKGEGISDAEIRLVDRIDLFKFSDISGLAGYGIGTTYQGNSGNLTKKIPVYHEEEGERLVLELGIIGGILIILLRFFIFLYAFYSFINMKQPNLKLYALSLSFLLLPPILTLNNTTFNYLDNFLYWFTFGLIIALKKIDLKISAKNLN